MNGSSKDHDKGTLQVNDYERQPRSLTSGEEDAYSGVKSGQGIASQARYLSPSPAPSFRSLISQPGEHVYLAPGDPSTLQQPSQGSSIQRFWARNMGACFVAASQLFGALMNLTARLLELDGDGMHPVQALFLRQSLTMVCCLGYMWWTKTPEAPLGPRNLRILLVIRGIAGFMGIFGMWYSMMYLPLADATVITFLAPGIAGLLCYFILREPFTRTEQLATFIALMGVVLIAQPASLFTNSDGEAGDDTNSSKEAEGAHLPGLDHETTPEERLAAIGVALLGVCGAATAFTTLRMIGKRAHPLISVNFFAATSTLICTVALIGAPILNIDQPALRWTWPASTQGWFLLPALGILGFVMQYLLTAGLAADKSNRANAMVYTHMLFAVGFDRWVFHHTMNLMSFGGCALILGSALGVVLLRKEAPPQGPPKTVADDVERQGNVYSEAERSPMLVGAGGNTDEIPLEQLRLS